jgi:hypothetical protein
MVHTLAPQHGVAKELPFSSHFWPTARQPVVRELGMHTPLLPWLLTL